MKMIQSLKHFGIILFACFLTTDVSAGNPDRVGSAGASQLLINPWARSSGWGGANIASVRGLESLYGNVAGLAFTEKTELIFSRTSWLADIPINSFGFSQRLNETSVLALGITSISIASFITKLIFRKKTSCCFDRLYFKLYYSFNHRIQFLTMEIVG